MVELTKKNCSVFPAVHAGCTILEKKNIRKHLTHAYLDDDSLVFTDGRRLVCIPRTKVSHFHGCENGFYRCIKATKTMVQLLCDNDGRDSAYLDYSFLTGEEVHTHAEEIDDFIRCMTYVIRSQDPSDTVNPYFVEWAVGAIESGTVNPPERQRPIFFKGRNDVVAIVMPIKFNEA